MGSSASDNLEGAVAVIGMSGRFPGARDLDEFWRNLSGGVESVSTFSPDEVIAAGVEPSVLEIPDYVRAGGVLEDAELFDAQFFGFNPREAESIDPQQRVFMECAWQALEDAGYDPERYGGLIGVYAGSAMSTYLYLLYRNAGFVRQTGYFQLLIGNDKDYLTTHTAYKLNLKGPCISVQTACSSSLVAVGMACQSLLDHHCDMALAGGVNIKVPQKTGYLYQPEGIYSPDGHCRAFDAKGQGTVFGNGVGVVVLKRLADARADGDWIHAVVRGYAINNDGSMKVGYTAPSQEGQAEVIAMAQAVAGVDPETITYVEAHGTGTALGDPIEIDALTQAFGRETRGKNFCAVGSVKTNIGHLDPAAGVAGFIKTVLSLKHKMIPPSLYFETPNPGIDFANSPFYVNASLSEWRANGTPRRAGVSAFGIGGTNAHVVLEEAPEREGRGEGRPYQLLLLSAKTESALSNATANMAKHLSEHPQLDIADAAYTSQIGRRGFGHRKVVLCQSLEEAAAALSSDAPAGVRASAVKATERPVFFMFPGQGSQYVNMGHDLYRGEPVFREHVDACAETLGEHIGCDIRDVLYPDGGPDEASARLLEQTALTQPALFTIEYALAKLWMEWGVRPRAMIGHSIGEYVAACLSGVLSLDDALALVAERARLMQQLPGGSMLAVPLPESEVRRLVGDRLSLASVNAPSLCVVSGPDEEVGAAAALLAAEGLTCRRLRTSHAFHSTMMEPILAEFVGVTRQMSFGPPRIPYLSNVSGTWATETTASDPHYWAAHLRQTVRFSEGLRHLTASENCVLLEVGPGQTLSSLARQHFDKGGAQVALSSLRHPDDRRSDTWHLLNTLGSLWLLGVEIDWASFSARERRMRVPLPTYPFERQRYWAGGGVAEKASPARAPSLGKRNLEEWFYTPAWKRTDVLTGRNGSAARDQRWLIFADRVGLGARLAARFRASGAEVTVVQAGARFTQLEEHAYEIDPRVPEHYFELLTQLRARGRMPDRVAHLWGVTEDASGRSDAETFERHQESGFYSLLFLAQALVKQKLDDPLGIAVVSNGMYAVNGDDLACASKATALALCKTIPQEYPLIRCRSIDLEASAGGGPSGAEVVEDLAAELTGAGREHAVAYRKGKRWLQHFERVQIGEPAANEGLLSAGGAYLITGGLGNIGLTLAEDMARRAQAKLVLLGRSALPVKRDWDEWLRTHHPDDAVSHKLRRLQHIESLGGEVMSCSADVADEEAMADVVRSAEARFGRLRGVIHGAGALSREAFFGVGQAERGLCELHFRPKVHGALTLEKVLSGRELDFFMVISSLSSVLGGLGFSAYAAANSYLDGLVSERNRQRTTPWFGVGWDAWDFSGESSNGDEQGARAPSMLPAEGVETFRRILTKDSPRHVVVSASDLSVRLKMWVDFETLDEPRPDGGGETASHPRPANAGPYVAPRNELERSIVGIWRELLGIGQIGVNDNFFTELNGHSLLATQLVSRLRGMMRVELPLHSFFENPTVAQLALKLEEIQKDEGAAEAEAAEPSLIQVRREAHRVKLTSGGALEIPEELRRKISAS